MLVEEGAGDADGGNLLLQETFSLGAGRALLRAAIAYAEGREGILRINLTVTQDNEPAVTLYRSAGFESFGVEPMAILTPSGYKSKIHMSRAVARDAA